MGGQREEGDASGVVCVLGWHMCASHRRDLVSPSQSLYLSCSSLAVVLGVTTVATEVSGLADNGCSVAPVYTKRGSSPRVCAPVCCTSGRVMLWGTKALKEKGDQEGVGVGGGLGDGSPSDWNTR